MDRHHWIFLYIIGFVFLTVLLKAFGIINPEAEEILSYAFIFSGLSLVFISLGNDKRGSLFLGTVIFLAGIILFIRSYFSIIDDAVIIFPSVFFILGTGFLMLFLDETTQRAPLYIAMVFIFIGLIFTFFLGSLELSTFLYAIPEIAIKALPFIIIAGALLLLLKFTRQ